ncbi:MAG: hypothetical protein IKQ63_10150 [Eubacterium sp.]|nr:hypothetical protein [Eubacterium sp.]
MNYNRIKLLVMVALFVSAAFFMVKGEKVNARTATGSGVESVSESIGSSINGVDVLKDSSGVAELDQAADRTNKLINWVCGWIGGIMALFGFIWAAMNQAGHNTESRNMGIIVGAIGVVIAFAPSIVNWILGK